MTYRAVWLLGAGYLLIGVAVLEQHAEASEPPIRPGGEVVTTEESALKVGTRTLATVPVGTRLTATAVKGNWVAVTVRQNEKEISGWIQAEHLQAVLTETPSRSPSSPSEPVPAFADLKVTLENGVWIRSLAKDGQWSGWSLSQMKFDRVESKIACGSQTSRIAHSGHVLAAVEPLTFRMTSSDPLVYAKKTGAVIDPKEAANAKKTLSGLPEGAFLLDPVPGVSRFPKASTIVWIEPGKTAHEIVVTTDPIRITGDGLKAVGLTRATLPKLKLEFSIDLGSSQIGAVEPMKPSIVWLFGEGAQYWGATSGPVMLDGTEYRNLRGARVENGLLMGSDN